MQEKLYYKDENVKVTNLRMTANHVTVPIDRIENITVDFKVASMTAALTVFLVSLIFIPVGCCIYGHCCWLGILVVIASLIYLICIYRTYTELKISTGERTFKILDANMRNRERIFMIEEALKDAVKEKIGKEK